MAAGKKSGPAKRVAKTPIKEDVPFVSEVDTPRSPRAESTTDTAGVPPPPRPAPRHPVDRPKTSYISVYFFAASFLFKAILVPIYGSLNVTGVVNRWSYPSAYTAPGVRCSIEALDGPKFCEHEVILEDQGIALLSCDPGRGEWNTVMGPLKDPEPKGQLWLYDYADTKRAKQVDLSSFPAQFDFHPLGINHFRDAMKTSLFVINHQRTGPSIEVFSLDPSKGLELTLSYERSIKAQPLIKSANGVVAIDHDHLYVTNDHAWTRLSDGSPWALLETFGGSFYGQSWLTHIDLSREEPVLLRAYEGLAFANGLAKGRDGTLYAASSVQGSVTTLRPRNMSTPILKSTGDVVFGYSIDNVHVDTSSGEDVLIVGGHPSFLALTKLSRQPHSAGSTSPSWISFARRRTAEEVEELKSSGGKKSMKDDKAQSSTRGQHYEPLKDILWETRTLYQDDGHLFSSSTGAAVDAGRDVLVGTGLYETGVLVCRGVKGAISSDSDA